MGDGSPVLEGVHLRKTYRIGRIDVSVLRGASLSVNPGEWVAILGSSGSGKSTLLHLLGGLDRPDAIDGGDVRFRGRSLASRSASWLDRYRRQDVGFVFQHYHLLPELTVLENAALPCTVGGSAATRLTGSTATRARCESLLASCGLAHRLRHRPAELSGGERQRVALVRALAGNPAVLLADEPTGNLDAASGAAILDIISNAHRDGLSIAMVTHDAAVASRADRVVRLIDGTVASA